MTVEHSPALDALGTALAKAQAAVKGAKKDAANPFYKTQYADLASTWEACREALTVNGLSVVQLPGAVVDGTVTLTTMLLHASGQWIKGTAAAPLAKQDAQGVGSALTYLRRYALAAVASVAPEDDDGNAASRPAYRENKATTRSGTGVRVTPTAPTAQELSEPPAVLSEPDPEAFPAKVIVWPFAKVVGSLKTGVALDHLVPTADLQGALAFIAEYITTGVYTRLVEKKGIRVARDIEAIRDHIQLLLDERTNPEAA